MELSVVIPCLNEAGTLGECIERAHEGFERLAIAGEVVVADNGSTDGSRAIAESLGARVVPVAERGYGAALRTGIEAARGEWVVMGDADATYDFAHLERFVDRLRAGADLVVGNRFRGGIEPGAMPWLHRYVGTPALTLLSRWFFHSRCGDINCGLRAFRRDAILSLELRSSGMEFASEMIVKAALHGLEVAEVPTTLSVDRRDRTPHLRRWRDGWRHMRLLLLYSPDWLFLWPGLALMVLGALVVALLLPGSRTIGAVTFDIHTLLYAAIGVVVGFQAVLFSALAKAYAVSEGLLPASSSIVRVTDRVSLEGGIVAGLAIAAIGLAGAAYTVAVWGSRSFGDLDAEAMLRVAIPSSVLLALGFQIVLASFFLSVLALKRGR